MGETISDSSSGEGGLAARVDRKEGKGSPVISLHPLLSDLAANSKYDEIGRKNILKRWFDFIYYYFFVRKKI